MDASVAWIFREMLSWQPPLPKISDSTPLFEPCRSSLGFFSTNKVGAEATRRFPDASSG